MMKIEGRNTLTAYNSVGIAYAWDTTIKSITEENGEVTVIHKPKGKKSFYKHTYTKDQELKIYKGWLNAVVTKDIMTSYDEKAFNMLTMFQDKLIYQM